MREALLKKRCGIPAALLLVLLLVGTAVAWYSFTQISSTTKVEEPLSVTETKEFDETMYPGQSNTWSFEITNSADVEYLIKADLTYNAPSGVSITDFKVGIIHETDDLLDDGSAEFDIMPGQTLLCKMTIEADKDAKPGHVSVALNLCRG